MDIGGNRFPDIFAFVMVEHNDFVFCSVETGKIRRGQREGNDDRVWACRGIDRRYIYKREYGRTCRDRGERCLLSRRDVSYRKQKSDRYRVVGDDHR